MLIVTADDLGLHPAINKGVMECVAARAVTAVSLVAQGAAIAEAITFVKKNPQISAGVHLTLVGERPLTTGRLPKNYKQFLIEYMLGRLDLAAVRHELAAQIDFLQAHGIKLQHADSHQHLHLLPGIADIVVQLCQEKGIARLRTVREPLTVSVRTIPLLILRLLSARFVRLCNRAGITTTDRFYGFTTSMRITAAVIQQAKAAAQDKLVELMCHPGYHSEAYPEWQMDWDRERLTVLANLGQER